MSPGVEEPAVNQICGFGFYPVDFSRKEKKLLLPKRKRIISQLLLYLKYFNGFWFFEGKP